MESSNEESDDYEIPYTTETAKVNDKAKTKRKGEKRKMKSPNLNGYVSLCMFHILSN